MFEPSPQRSPEATPQQTAAKFREDLERLHETQHGLAKRMWSLGDKRPFSTILRGVQRMASGETRVSGEMQAIIGMLIRERKRAEYFSAKLKWSTKKDGGVIGTTDLFEIYIRPRNNKWEINVKEREERGYVHDWPVFPKNLEDAKIQSLIWLEDAVNYLRDLEI